jgi:hypothetical protein
MKNECDKENAMGVVNSAQDCAENIEIKAPPEVAVFLDIKWGEGVRTGFV